VRSIAATVSNVLRFHNSAAGSMRPVDLASVLKSSAEFAMPMARQNGIAIKLQEQLEGAHISGDPEGLKQVMMNLFCNALRHTAPDGVICVKSWVRKHKDGNKAVIECTDTGIGINPRDLPHIFEPGFTTTGSSGLGLAVCRRIVEQHAGRIGVRSELGRGTTFEVEIPAL